MDGTPVGTALPLGGGAAPNRFVKAPMEEMLATFQGGPPNDAHCRLYRTWADGGWGTIITGACERLR